MKELKYNSGTLENPTILDKRCGTDEYIVLGSDVYILRNDVIVSYAVGSTLIKEMRGSSQVNVMRGSTSINSIGAGNAVNCQGYNLIRAREPTRLVKLNDTSQLLLLPSIGGNFDFYKKSYPVQVLDDIATMYKAVRKTGDILRANYDGTEYRVGEELSTYCHPSTDESCTKGLHLSHLQWAANFGKGGDNMAIIECTTNVSDIVVSSDCDGKVRTSKLFVVREVPKEEYAHFLNQ